jgi:Spx/MgsR family transcriptional regulator
MDAENHLYGLNSCDSCRNARRWLRARSIEHTFTDIRTDTPGKATLTAWRDAVGWEALINRRSATWRNLDEETRAACGASSAVDLAAANPTLIKRPVLVAGSVVVVGFSPERYAEIFDG